jgi:hypothetical protein
MLTATGNPLWCWSSYIEEFWYDRPAIPLSPKDLILRCTGMSHIFSILTQWYSRSTPFSSSSKCTLILITLARTSGYVANVSSPEMIQCPLALHNSLERLHSSSLLSALLMISAQKCFTPIRSVAHPLIWTSTGDYLALLVSQLTMGVRWRRLQTPSILLYFDAASSVRFSVRVHLQ